MRMRMNSGERKRKIGGEKGGGKRRKGRSRRERKGAERGLTLA